LRLGVAESTKPSAFARTRTVVPDVVREVVVEAVVEVVVEVAAVRLTELSLAWVGTASPGRPGRMELPTMPSRATRRVRMTGVEPSWRVRVAGRDPPVDRRTVRHLAACVRVCPKLVTHSCPASHGDHS